MKGLKGKCACYAGGIGICLCIVFMSLGVIGVTVVGISNNGNMERGDMGNNNSMSGMSTTTTTTTRTANVDALSVSQNRIMTFFSGV